MTRLDSCQSCAAPILWAQMDTGGRNPLNLEPQDFGLKPGIVAFNPRTGGGHALHQADIDRGAPAQWARIGVTFHLSHFADCPNRAAHKGRPRNQPEGAKQ